MPTIRLQLGGEFEIPAEVVDFESFRRWTVSDAFPETGRFSWIDDQLEIDMNAEHASSHNDPKTSLMLGLGNLAESLQSGHIYTDGMRLVNTGAALSVEPDLIYFRWETLRDGRVTLTRNQMELVGSPDLVVEILSPSSVRKDRRVLRQKYFEAGIAEYWLIDARGEELKFELLVRSDEGFVETAADGDGFRMSSVWQRRFRLTRDRNQFDFWRYRLEHHPA